MLRRFVLPIVLLLSPFAACQAQPSPDADAPAETVSAPSPDPIFDRLMAGARQQRLHERALGEVMQHLGEQLAGTPYVAGVLDAPEDETLLAPLDKFDCVLFVESMLAMAQGIVDQDYSYDGYLGRIEAMRYRDGQMNGYCSRLHYFSDWIRDNERRGVVEDITAEIGGVPYEKTINFMSRNRSSYPRLVASDSLFRGIVQMEEDLRGHTLHYIPQNRIREAYADLQAGDIVATATSIGGLDVTHTGLVYDAGNGRKGFLHASTTDGVTIARDLQAYIQGVRVQTGILVARPLTTTEN